MYHKQRSKHEDEVSNQKKFLKVESEVVHVLLILFPLLPCLFSAASTNPAKGVLLASCIGTWCSSCFTHTEILQCSSYSSSTAIQASLPQPSHPPCSPQPTLLLSQWLQLWTTFSCTFSEDFPTNISISFTHAK